jgi:hypothetical protein
MRYTIFKMGMLLGILVVFAAGARPQKQAATQEQKAEPQSQAAPSRPSGMMGGGMMGGDAPTMAEMRAIHELMVNHDRISRTVTNLTDGIRTVTESNDPEIAKTIQEHVLTMNQHVSVGNDPGLPMESPALHSIFRNADKVQTSIQTTAKGVVVVQTSTDPATVAALQQHASEVSNLVKDGMAAMRAAMMKNGMHGGMMGTPPTNETPAAVTPRVQDQDSISQNHDQHHADVNRRGEQVMGFDQEKTTHHFHLYSDGGAIDVAVNDLADKANLEAIRAHLPHIGMMFSQGNFEAPMLVHDTNVPGTAEMAKLKDRITYKYAETPKGGRVNITTSDAEALKAVHAFLKFQIADHKTGDSLEVRKR